MSTRAQPADADLKSTILAILDENRIMSLATLRPDGWPQVTLVGFIHDDLDLYFAIARSSQKFANLAADPRVSIAVGQDQPDHLRGLSMAAEVREVVEPGDVARLNTLLWTRYPQQAVFAPREASSALMRATPSLVSVIDMSKAPGPPVLVKVGHETTVRPLSAD